MLRDTQAVYEGAEETLAARKRLGYTELASPTPYEDQFDLFYGREAHEGVNAPIVPVMVESVNERGLTVTYGGILDGHIAFKDLSRDIDRSNLEALLGQELQVMAYAKEARPLAFNHKLPSNVLRLENFETGQLVEGEVKSVNRHYVVIGLEGGVSALLSGLSISRERVETLKDVSKPGDRIKAVVSVKRYMSGVLEVRTDLLEYMPGEMLRNPQLVYDNAEEMVRRFAFIPPGLKAGDLVEGVVRYVRPCAAYVDLEGSRFGFLHTRYMSHAKVKKAEDVVKPGDRIKAVIIPDFFLKEAGVVGLSTRVLELTPGDMLRDPQLVYDRAEDMYAADLRRREKQPKHSVLFDVLGDINSSI